MDLNLWAQTILDAPQKARTKIKKSVLEGIKYFKASYAKKSETSKEMPPPSEIFRNGKTFSDFGFTLQDYLVGPQKYEVKSFNKDAEQLFNDLKSEKGARFVGFVPEINYIKETGNKLQLGAIWNHPFGSPALLYAHKELPILIIAGPDIMFNDSMVKNIDSNNWREGVAGITG